jgi:hypothetical protein
LALPRTIVDDTNAFELLTVWAAQNQIAALARAGTGLDTRPKVWGQILAGIGENIALTVQRATGAHPSDTLAAIKASLDENWKGSPSTQSRALSVEEF